MKTKEIVTEGKSLEIVSQEEYEANKDFDGTLIIEGRGIKIGGNSRVVLVGIASAEIGDNVHAELRDRSNATLRGDSRAVLYDRSQAVLYGSSSATLNDCSSAELADSTYAELHDSSSADLRGSSRAMLHGSSKAHLSDNAHAMLHEHSRALLTDETWAKVFDEAHAELWGGAGAEIYDKSHAVLHECSWAVLTNDAQAVLTDCAHARVKGHAHAVLWNDAHAELWDYATAIALDNTFVLLRNWSGSVKKLMNATVVQYKEPAYDAAILDAIAEHQGGKLVLYKSVIPKTLCDFRTGKVKYAIGTDVVCPDWDPDPARECGGGLHLSLTPEMADKYRRHGTILRCLVDPKDVVVYEKSLEKVRCRKVRPIAVVDIDGNEIKEAISESQK